MTFAGNLDRAAATAVCSWLTTGGNAALSTAVVGGLLTPGGQVPALAAGLGLLALSYGCAFDPNGTAPLGEDDPRGCKASTSGFWLGGMYSNEFKGYAREELWRSVAAVSFLGLSADRLKRRYRYDGVHEDGRSLSKEIELPIRTGLNDADLFLYPMTREIQAGTCTSSWPSTSSPRPGLPNVTHQDNECSIEVEFLAWQVQPDGRVAPVMKMSPKTTALASGGIIQGCNFNPVIYVGEPGGGGGGGGGTYIPWNPGPDNDNGDPWWADLIKSVGTAALSALLADLFRKLFEEKVAGTVYRLTSVCELNDNGEPVSYSREAVIPDYPLLKGAIARLDAIPTLTQGLKDFRQPICKSRKRQGQPVTVSFDSLEASPQSTKYLRKKLGYLDQTGATMEEHLEHWKAFQWEAGPVCVIHYGGVWGHVQVWAASEDEGRRVIAHAADIAGVDLAAPGSRWSITRARDPRYGQPGTMRVSKKGGVWGVTKRIGPNGVPRAVEVTDLP